MKSCQTSRTQNSAFEVDPHLRMQNTSKPGVVTPIVLAVWVCAAVEAWGRFQCPGGTTLPKCYRIPPLPPPRAGLKKERQTSLIFQVTAVAI